MFILELGFWAIAAIIIFIVSAIISVEFNSIVIGIGTIFIGVAVAIVGFNVPVLATIINYPLLILAGALIYLFFGGLYTTFYKWPAYIKSHTYSIKESYRIWAASRAKHNKDTSFEEFMQSTAYNFNASSCIEELSTWIMLWPFSFVWVLSHKPVIMISKVVYNTFSGLLQKVGKKTTTNILKEK